MGRSPTAICAIAWLLPLLLPAGVAAADSAPLLRELHEAVPATVEECTEHRRDELARLSEELDRWGAGRTWVADPLAPAEALADLREMLEVQRRVDAERDRLFTLRTHFVERPDDSLLRDQLRCYLRSCTTLIDLSGRLRYLLRDRIDRATYEVEVEPERLAELVELLIEYRSGIGASVLTYLLFDLPPEEAPSVPLELKLRVLDLVEATGHLQLLPDLAELLEEAEAPPRLLVRLGEVVRRIGLPQVPRPGSEAQPTLSPHRLRDRLAAVDPASLSAAEQASRASLLRWLEDRIAHGVRGDTFRIANFDLRPGDWLLMRNPSPYNRFTDVAPGLFTHVGVVVAETGDDGIRRFVLVDLPERGSRIPAIDCHTYLQETLHFVFMRHPEEKVQAKLAATAASMIGNETEFDLTFQTDRVEQYRGQPLEGRRIHTYCAGFLLICAQEAADRAEFFPLPERRAEGRCSENLAAMGISIGDRIISPTGALFSPKLELVASCEPMYDPGREIKEAVYDFFAEAMRTRRLRPSPTAAQHLRERVAGLAAGNRWLAQALANLNNVSPHMDLVSAARAAAVIETLDQIAREHAERFERARRAVTAESLEALREELGEDALVRQLAPLRDRHADLVEGIAAGRVSPRDLRVALVAYYSEAGRRELAERFFPEEEQEPDSAASDPDLPPPPP